MAIFIKNQIIKHLSIFAKNLKPDQISLEVLSGSGELRDIVLNEAVLAEKLELPPFLKLKRAECNRVKVKIPWTKLQSSPINIIVDELHITLELGTGKAADPSKKSAAPTSYGWIDRVIEGLSIKVNVVDISFESESFSGSLWLSPLEVKSKSPAYADVTNLKKTRVTDSSSHQTIFFKQVTWNLMKIQAFAHQGSSDRGKRLNSPLRLITQGGRCRIAIKKDTNDGNVIAARLQIIFEDIHWVATLAEIRSAIAFQRHIVELAKASSNKAPDNPFLQDFSAKSRSKQQTLPNPAIKSTSFSHFDVGQTSHHVYISKVYLTLIDDNANAAQFPDNWNIRSGAIQVTLEKISIDFYLQNLITDERRYWVRYNTPNEFTAFCGSELERHLTNLSIGLDSSARERLKHLWSTLTSQTLVARIEDVIVEGVSEQSSKRDDLQDVYTSRTSAKYTMPQNVPAFHFEFSNYYFPGSNKEAPSNLAHLVVGPANCVVDNKTIRWLLYVVDNITRTLDIVDSEIDPPAVCARVDLLMPRLIIPCQAVEGDNRYPERFVLNVSTVKISNRALENETFSMENLFQSLKDDNIGFISSLKCSNQHELRNHVLQSKQVAAELATNGATVDLLPTRWFLSTSPCWIDAVLPTTDIGPKCLTGVTVVSDVMLAGCIDAKLPNLFLALEPLNPLSVVVDHFQFLQFMRVQKSINDLFEQIEIDKNFFSAQHHVPVPDTPLSLYLFCEEINVHLVLPVEPVPNPYNPHTFVKSDTMTSISSELLPEDKPTPTENVMFEDRPLSSIGMKETPATAITPSPVPPIVIQTKDIEFADFGNGPATIADDLVSNLDESMSIISDDDFLPTESQMGDDIFPEVAEEAVEVDEATMTKRQLKLLERNVNALSATLSNFNIVVSNSDHKSTVTGYSLALTVAQELNIPLKNIMDKHRAPSVVLADKGPSNNPLPNSKEEEKTFKDAHLQFQVRGEGVGESKYAHIEAKVQHLNASLNEQIISYLGPFIEDEDAKEDPVYLELNIENSDIQIINSKKRNPLKIHVGALSIVDGEKREI